MPCYNGHQTNGDNQIIRELDNTSNYVRAWQRKNNLLYRRWHERGCTVKLCVGTAATVACVP
jgi:hypothetical protein